MSIDDENRAQCALSHYLSEWGVEDAATKARRFIDELTSRGWQMAPMHESRPQPPKLGEQCHGCQRHRDRCICRQPVTRPAETVPANHAWASAREQMREHRPPTAPPPPPRDLTRNPKADAAREALAETDTEEDA